MNTIKPTKEQQRKIERALQRHEDATRNQIEQTAFEISQRGGEAIERHVKLLQRYRTAMVNQKGMGSLVNMIDWGMECCWKFHPSYSAALDKFIQEASQQ